MEINDTNLNSLSACLQNSLSADVSVRRAAESSLQTVETNEGYPLLLMALMHNANIPLEIRVACSVTMKNFVKRCWKPPLDPEEPNKITPNDRLQIKSQILNLMLTVPEQVRRQLAETVSLIGSYDFPEQWPQLIDEIVAKLDCADMATLNSVLLTADSLFKRYGHEMKSDRLWLEIKYVLEHFAAPLLALFEKVCALAFAQIQSNQSDAILKQTYECLLLISQIFYSLNAQDLPEFFEDHMKQWMEGFLKLLSTDVSCLRGDPDDEEPGVMESLKSQICDNVAMYAQKYDEEFDESTYLEQFVRVIWQLLVSTGQQVKYDGLVSNAIQFLACVCEREQYKRFFVSESGEALAQICEKVVVPNAEFRPQDQELFDDNPEEFIRRDIEGSDVDTRRRSAADLVRALCKHFESDVVRILAAYIEQLLLQYASDPFKMWPKKDAAVYMVVTLCSKGQTARFGVTKTSELVNLLDFYASQLAADINDTDFNRLPVLKADALKFVVTFRSHFPKQIILSSVLPGCVNLLKSDSVVVHTYAAHALERFFVVRDPTTPRLHLFNADDLKPFAESLLSNLFSILETKPASAENEYVMKCIMRSFWLLSDHLLLYVDMLLQRVARKISLVAKNPSKPFFNHYLFETLCLLIKARQKAADNAAVLNAEIFENVLFPIFQDILQQDVQEFMPYVFQILSLTLDIRPAGSSVPDGYLALFPFLLMPALWGKSGNVPALVKLIQAFIRVDVNYVAGSHLNAVLGVFQKLLFSRTHDAYSFGIVDSLVEYAKFDQWPPLTLKKLLTIIFTRLSNEKTVKLVKSLIYFVCLFTVRYGAQRIIESIDALQDNMFGAFLTKIFLPDLQKIGGKMEKKVCCVAVVQLLTEIPDITLTGKYAKFWPSLLEALVALFELPEQSSDDEAVIFDAEDGQSGYSAAYSQLAFACALQTDPTTIREQPKAYLARCLQKLRASSNLYAARVSTNVETLHEESKRYLKQYLTTTGINL